MNLYLHGAATTECPIERADALSTLGSERYDLVLANRHLAKTGLPIVGEDATSKPSARNTIAPISSRRPATSSLTSCNTSCRSWLSMARRGGAADNVLFEAPARNPSAPARQLRLPHLAAPADRHFYKPGVKANVLFFDRKPASEQA